MQCNICFSLVSIRWRNNVCNSCYQKDYRIKNIKRLKEYDCSNDRRFYQSQRVAKRRKIIWQLSLEEYSDLCNKPCHYCSNKLGKIVTTGIGLDRINNNLGYIKGNILSCCEMCNRIRSEFLSVKEMEEVSKLLCKLRNI